MPTESHDHETEYERTQRSNPLVHWLHSFRWKVIESVFEEFVEKIDGSPIRVVEIGAAVGRLYEILDERFDIDYVGIEIDEEFVQVARERYGQRPNFTIIHDSARNALKGMATPHVVIALETMEHMPEHDAVRIIEALGRLRPSLFVCSVPVEIGPIVWFKNMGSLLMRYRRVSRFGWETVKRTFWASVYRIDKLPPHRLGHTGFDWRWVANTIRYNMTIQEIRKLPLNFLPAGLSTNVFMLAVPREDEDAS